MRKFAFDHKNKRIKVICLLLVLAFGLVFCLFSNTGFALGSEEAVKTAAAESPAPTTSEAPAASSEAPAASSETPAASSEAPAASSEAPAASSPAPAATSPAPATTSEAPAATTSEAPAATTSEAPAATTSEAPAATTSPAPAATATATAPAATATATATAPAATATAPVNTDQSSAGPSATPTETNQQNSPVMVEQTIEATANGYRVSISGMMPEGSKIKLTAAGSGVAEKVADATGTEGDAVFAYDIKIIGGDGAEYQPEELKVNVSISGLDLEQGDKVTMLHVLDDPEATEKAVAAGDAKMISGQGIADKDKVAVTTPSVSVNTDKGVVNFSTSSFSTYIILMSTVGSTNGSQTMNIGDTSTLNGSYWIDSWSTSDQNVVSIKTSNNRSATIIAMNAGTATITHKNNSNTTETWDITVRTIGAMLQDLNAVNTKGLVLAILASNVDNPPGEPSVWGNSNYYVTTSMSPVICELGTGRSLASSAANYISTSIYNSPDLKRSIDGSTTYGVVDTTGVKTKALLTNINWNGLRDYICANAKDRNGNLIYQKTSDNYKIIPYVVKLQMGDQPSPQWHVDCRLVYNNDVSLTYDLNLPSGITVNGIKTPDGLTGAPNSTTYNVPGYIYIGGNGSANQHDLRNPIKSDQGYILTFTGWKDQSGATKDQDGVLYDLNSTHTLKMNTVLSAQWSCCLQQHHIYYYVDGTQKYDDLYNYNAPITIRGNESKDGYDFSGWILHLVSVSGTTIATPSTMPDSDIYAVGTFTIKTYTINYHVDRDNNYTSQSFTINNASVTLAGKKNDGVSYTLHGWYSNSDCTTQFGDTGSAKTYAALVALDTDNNKSIDLYGYTTYKLTVNKTGGHSGDTFIFNITGSDGTRGSFTITGNNSVTLTASYNVTYTVTEKAGSGSGSWSWRYTAVGSQSSGKVTGDSSMTINNSYSNDHWLGDVAHVLNKLLGITPSAS